MKQITTLLVCAGALTFVSSAAPGGGHGTDILHFQVRTAMSNEGVEAGASGSVNASQNKQGGANNQQLSISVQGLSTNTPYSLLTALVGDTNLITVTNFTTDANGNASLQYRSQGNGHGNGHGHNNSLPTALNPVSAIQELDVFNSSTQAVLSADLTMPNQLQYLIKRDLSSGSVSAGLRIKATTSQTQFRLNASGLAATNDYYLVVNGGIVQTNTSDANGNLNVTSLASTLPILQVNSLALWDTSSNVVVNTTLP
jgi:hypothetical protein